MRLKIKNIWVDAITHEEAMKKVKHFLDEGSRPHSILCANPEKSFHVEKDHKLRECFREADLILPDGIGIVAAVRMLYKVRIKRVPGSDFFLSICKVAEENGKSIFLYGATEDSNLKVSLKLKELYPNIKIAGRSNGYIQKEQMGDLVKKINKSNAEILFVALGSPRQEKWYLEYNGYLNKVKIVQTVGGTFDVVGGKIKRAPELWRKYYCEWLYRLITNPKRICRQAILPLFTIMIIKEFLQNYKNYATQLFYDQNKKKIDL